MKDAVSVETGPGRKSLLAPNLILPSVLDITPALLDQHGIRGVILDADNTLVPRKSYLLEQAMHAWIEAMQHSGRQLCVLSNSNHVRPVAEMVAGYGIPSISLARKPLRTGFRQALARIGCEASETAMVGDQLFTDILGGNRAGMLTIMVHPMSSNDFIGYWAFRRLERGLLRYWEVMRKRGG